MKIKLVTFAPHPNFGTCLQSYALNYVLRSLGHDVEFIYNEMETPPESLLCRIKVFAKSAVKMMLPMSLLMKIRARKRKQNNDVGKTKVNPFILQLPEKPFLRMFSKLPFYNRLYRRYKRSNLQWEKVLKFTYDDDNFKMVRLFSKRDYADVVEDADIFITGSDQIWNPFCGGFNPMMFLEFVPKEKKCISYSSSISQPEIHPLVRERMKKDLSKFKHIAVREQRSVEMLNDLLGRNDVRLVVDPTYLLSSDEWKFFGNRAKIEFELPSKFIFVYLIGRKRKGDYDRLVEEVKDFTGIEEAIFLDCYDRNITFGSAKLYNDAGPYEWVHLLEKSSYVINDSFHATVFSLKFKKDFVHILKDGNNSVGSQNTRMYDILKRYDLLNKIYDVEDCANWHEPVDYSKVAPIMEEEIKDSLEYLKFEIDN